MCEIIIVGLLHIANYTHGWTCFTEAISNGVTDLPVAGMALRTEIRNRHQELQDKGNLIILNIMYIWLTNISN